MEKKNISKQLSLILLVLVVLVSRLPFLSAGYGAEEDSWGMAFTAYHIATTGVYEYSRLPGHPVHELTCSLFYDAGPFVFNFVTALFSALAVLFFALSMKKIGFRHYLLAAYAFAFVPVVYISSTYTIDYMWAMCFIMMSFYFIVSDKLWMAGVALGLAVGCRITSGAMLLPFCVYLWQAGKVKNSLKSISVFTTVTLLVSLVCFIPLLKNYGADFFAFYEQFPYPSLAKVIYKASFGVFGVVGFVCIVAALTALFRKRNVGILFERPVSRLQLASWVLVVVLYSIAYLRVPQKSAFIIPLVPFMLLLFGWMLSTRGFRSLCFGLIVSSFVFSINLTDKNRGADHSSIAFSKNISGQDVFFDPLSGPIFSEHSKRKNKMAFTDKVLSAAAAVSEKTVVIAGWWYNELMVKQLKGRANPQVEFVFYIDEKAMNDSLARGYTVGYLPEQDIFNDEMFDIHSTALLAKPFP